MNRREILNELQQIVALTDTVGFDHGIEAFKACIPEAAQRAKGLIQVIESWPIAFPPAPFVSDQCCEQHHGECQLGSANQPFSRLCHCACHCPPEAPQQPREPALPTVPQPFEAWRKEQESAYEAGHDQAAANQPPARHIDTPDELLELLAGVSSDPQIEGLSLAQKASTMALLYAAKALQEIAESTEALLMNSDFIAEIVLDRSLKAESKQEPS